MSELDAQIAFITNNPRSAFLESLQAGFAEHGVHPASLIVVSPRARLLAEWRRHRLLMATRVLGPKLTAAWRVARRRGARGAAAGQGAPGAPAATAAPTVHRTRELNSDATAALLRRLGVRYLVNAGAGIFREPVLGIPGLVVVNAHAGKLPDYRNMNVVEWALANGEPVVGTVHRIDAGIDTGPVLLERPLDLAGARSIEDARERAFDQVARLVAPAVLAAAAGELGELAQPAAGGRNWYVMHPRLRRRLERRLRESGG